VSTWTFIWLLVILKIPIVALFMIVRWAIGQTPETETQRDDGGIGPRPLPTHPHHPRPTLPRLPRRGPHAGRLPSSPPRVRAITARQRLAHS
jgi:hypothetical protein